VDRRIFIAGMTASLAAVTRATAQPSSRVWRVAYLIAAPAPELDRPFDSAMKELGYIEGRNLIMERTTLGARREVPDEIVQEVVRLNPDLIVAWAGPIALAVKRATTSIPVVFIAVRGPVERGLVPSLGRPGGNVTGLSTYAVETIDPKLIEVAKELFPRLTRAGILSSSVDPPGAVSARERAAKMLNITLVPIPFSDDKDLLSVPDAIRRSGVPLLIASDTPLLYARRRDVVEFAARSRLPVVYAFREAVEEGGLMALSTDLQDLARRAAGYVDKIFKGSRPGELPVEQPTRLQFTVNLKTARALGLTIPPSLLLRADQVIDRS
jgi:putative ABC transport system substrate-binding protein